VRLRTKTRYALERPVLRRPSKIIDPSLDKINTKIPKQVRDDNEWSLRERRISSSELVSASRSRNRCALKNEDPLDAEGFEQPRKIEFDTFASLTRGQQQK